MVFKIKVVYSLQRHLVVERSNGCAVPTLLSLCVENQDWKAKLLEGDTRQPVHTQLIGLSGKTQELRIRNNTYVAMLAFPPHGGLMGKEAETVWSPLEHPTGSSHRCLWYL